MIKKEAVRSFLTYEGKMLLLLRSLDHKYGRNKWSVVSGFVKEGETPYDAALREISEETSIQPIYLSLVGRSGVIEIPEKGVLQIIYPFHFNTKTDKVRLEREHREYRWINPEEVFNFDCVKCLKEGMRALDLLEELK